MEESSSSGEQSLEEKSITQHISNEFLSGLMPNTNNLKILYKEDKLQFKTKEALDIFLRSCENLSKIEYATYHEAFTSIYEANLVEQIGKTKSYSAAERLIKAMQPSSAFKVQIQFNKDDRLISAPELQIRTSGTQYRHVTPIGIIERIFLQACEPGTTILSTMRKLLTKVEVFKISKDTKTDMAIQAVFDYFFKNRQYHDVNGIIFLMKIIMHFYHQNLYLVMKSPTTGIAGSLN